MSSLTTKRLCRAGIIAALYAALTYVFTPLAFGPFQVRPAEAFCLLPLLFPEAIFGLAIGCALSNLASPYLLYDLIFGSLSTLIAAFGAYLVGRFCKKEGLRVFFCGLFPVIINALVLPFMLVFLCAGGEGYSSAATAYFTIAAFIALSECIWVYALGAPLYFALRKRSGRFLSD